MDNLSPVILFTYNRPRHSEQTLTALTHNELADNSVLYIYCDGPKPDATTEQLEKINQVRKVVRKQKWCKEVHIIESDNNKGLANSIILGVTEVIDKYGKVIVLEDDLLTSRYFLKFMNEALDYYNGYPAVFSVSANRPPVSKMKIPDDYKYDVFACLRSYSTGWATWADRWKKVDWQMNLLEEFMKQPEQIEALNRAGDDMTDLILMQRDGKIDSWAMRFGFAHFVHHAVAILPCISYIDNIGFDGTGIHSGTIAETYHNDVSKPKREVRFLDIIYEDKRIINTFYNAFCAKKRPLWKKGINCFFSKIGMKPVFVIKKKVYA